MQPPTADDPRDPREPRVESRWLQMRDGARIAIDLRLPSAVPAEGSLAAVLILTREWRSVRNGLLRAGSFPGPEARLADALLAGGFAVIVADVRGTGASDGTWRRPWTDEEVEDGGEIIDWVGRQPWSNGRVATAGVGYGGTSALLLAAARADLRGAAAQVVDVDLFGDVAFPGGVRNDAVLRHWSDRLADLDANHAPASLGRFGRLPRWLGGGVRPVDEDPRGTELGRMVASRRIVPLGAAFAAVEARDDAFDDEEITVGDLGIPGRMAALAANRVPMGLWASWFDGATADGALRLWSAIPAIRECRITATDRTGADAVGPFAEDRRTGRQPLDGLGDLVGFLDTVVRRDDLPSEERSIRYVTLGSQGWQAAQAWPPPDVVTVELFVGRDGRLRWEQGHDVGSVVVPLDANATTGHANRWHARLGGRIRTWNRAAPSRRPATWTSEPLPEDVTITGQPVAMLAMRIPAEDAVLLVHLELVAPDGAVSTLTDGLLRAAHRGRRSTGPTFLRRDMLPLVPGERTELRIPLQPTSARIPARWRLRLAVAGADRDTFAVPRNQPAEVTVEFGGPSSSRLLLPIVE